MQNKLKDYLGLCRLSKNLRYGSEVVLDLIKKKKAKLVILSSAASQNTKKKFYDKTKYYNISIIEIDYIIINSVFNNLDVKVVAILDDGFKDQILKFKGM